MKTPLRNLSARVALIALCFSAVALFTGCQGTLGVAKDAATNDYGKPPTDPMAAVKAWAVINLKDPYSADIRLVPNTGTQQGYLRSAPITGGKITLSGYLVECAINAKNSYGGFTGFKPYRFIVRDGVVVGLIHTGIKWYPEPWLRVGPDGSSI